MSQDELKLAAARYAIDKFVKSGMKLGLGSGSTAEIFLKELASRVKAGDFGDFVCVATSDKVGDMATDFGLKVVPLNEVDALDVTIDGADEVDPATFGLTKGRGGALLREKLVAAVSRQEVIIVDESKLVKALGEKMPIPVEVSPFGWRSTLERLKELGGEPKLRPASSTDDRPYQTDSHNYVIDCAFATPPADPSALATAIKGVTGVVEHGLFIGLATNVVVAGANDTYELNKL